MNEKDSPLAREHAELAAGYFAGWAQEQGILARITPEQGADLAHAFTVGFAYGVGVGAGDARATAAVTAMAKLMQERYGAGAPLAEHHLRAGPDTDEPLFTLPGGCVPAGKSRGITGAPAGSAPGSGEAVAALLPEREAHGAVPRVPQA